MGREDLKPSKSVPQLEGLEKEKEKEGPFNFHGSSSIVFIFHFLLHGADMTKYILILASFSFFMFFCMERT